MSLSKETTREIIDTHKAKDNDTGSSLVQIALFTQRITDITEHLKNHPKDKHSRRGLLNLVNKRNKLLRYVYNRSHAEYRETVEKLGIRAKLDRH